MKKKIKVKCEICGEYYLDYEKEINSIRHKYNICKDCRKNGKIFICENCGKETHINIQAYLKDNRHLCKNCKIVKTCLELYGVTNGGASKQAHEKIEKTLKEHYGKDVKSSFAIKEVRDKSKETLMKNYGVDHNWKIEGSYEKKKTNLVIYYRSN